jgi:hypothetical protein
MANLHYKQKISAIPDFSVLINIIQNVAAKEKNIKQLHHGMARKRGYKKNTFSLMMP